MPQLARWLTFIKEFDYEIVHRDGKRHANADGLSRRARPPAARHEGAVESASQSTNREQLNTAYDTDSEPEKIMDSEHSELEEQIPSARPVHAPDKEPAETEAESSVRESLAARQQSDPEQPTLSHLSTESESAKRLYKQWERLEVQEGLVRRSVEGKPGEQPYSQLLVPRQSVQDVLHRCHEGMTGGHFGIRRTLDQVKRRFYWLTRKEDTIRFCKRCEPCNEYHRGKLRRTGQLQPVIAGAPYERWYIDFTGPHPRSERGHIYILTCVDAFTKWAEAFPLRSKEAEPIAKVLVEQVFCRFGSPVSLLRDQGKEVDGSIMKQVCRMLGIDKLRTTPHKPSTNQVERLHRSINAILGKTVASHQKDWDTLLSFGMSAYRASRHESTGYTPNMLTLGTEVRAPADIVYGSLDEPSTKTYDDHVESMRERMTTAYESTSRSSKSRRAQQEVL